MLLTGRLHRPKASRSLPLPSSRPSTSPSSLVLTSASSHTLQVVAAPLPKATASLRSAARARAAAKRLANAKEACGALSTAQLLRQSSVAPTSRRAYETGVQGFETFALANKWKLQSGSAVDEALLKNGAAKYELGEDAGPLEVSLGWCPVIRCPGSSSCSFATAGFLKRYHFWLPRLSCSLTLFFVLVHERPCSVSSAHRRRRVSSLGACCLPGYRAQHNEVWLSR